MTIFKSINDEKIPARLIDGEVGVLPTDSVMSLVCSAVRPKSAARLYKIKQRDNMPGTIIAASIDQLVGLGLKRRYLTAVEHYWPSTVSIVIPCGNELEYLHQGVGSLAVRVVENKEMLKLLKQTGPLLSTSANIHGAPESRSIPDAIRYFTDKVDIYVEPLEGLEQEVSTVIRVVDDAIEVLRQGAVNINEKGEILQ